MKKVKQSAIGERIEFATRFIPQCINLLDVGCGDGSIMRFIKNRVRSVYGLDNDSKLLKVAETRGFITRKMDLDREIFPFEKNYFDVITCLDVIEHVKNPRFLIKNIKNVLKKNGSLIITTPNIRFSDHSFTLIFKGIFPKTSTDTNQYDGGHIHFFTYTDIMSLLKEYNFKINIIEGIINKNERGWKGKLLELFFGKRLMHEFRSPGILLVAQKI